MPPHDDAMTNALKHSVCAIVEDISVVCVEGGGKGGMRSEIDSTHDDKALTHKPNQKAPQSSTHTHTHSHRHVFCMAV